MSIFLIWRGFARANALRQIGDVELVRKLSAQVSPWRRRWKGLFYLVATSALIAAVARPILGVTKELVRTQGVQVVIALDVSRSMDTEDIVPNRLERARFDLLDFINELAGNDFGIVLFAGEAYVYMPLTYDVNTARVFMNSVDTEMISMQGTNITSAIQTALTVFDERTNSQPVILIASDGENHEVDPGNIARFAAENNVIIHTIGYGTAEGGLIPIYDEFGNLIDYVADRNRQLVTSRLNSEVLQRVASDTGGLYQHVSGNGREVDSIIAAIRELESGDLHEEIVIRPIERFTWFVALALFFLSIEIMLPETRGEST